MRHYPRYKSSGVEWLGEIPFNWSTIKIKFMDVLIMGQSPESKDVTDYEKGLPFLQGNAEFTDTHPIPRYWCEKANKIAVVNDLLLSVRAPVGALNLSDQIYGIGRGLCAIRAHKNYVRFLYYLLSISKEELNKVSTGTTFVAITIPNLSNIKIPKVSLPEQQSIVHFLDFKTGQIDKFVANRKKQIELLKEQKAAIINRAVTKGINPNVKMKPSGIEYIGKICQHWEIWKIKYTSYVKGRIGWDGLRSDEFFENEYAYLVTGTDFDNGLINWETCYQITQERYMQDFHIQLKEEDLLITKDGTIGKTAVVKNLKGYASLNSGVFVVRPLRKYKSDFLYYVLNSNVFTQFINITTTGTTILHLYQNIFEVFQFPIPPIDEQQKIVDYIKEETASLDTLISKYQKQIDLMQEYRTALISQAVTGKIDVRDWKPRTKNYNTESFPISIAAEN